VRVALLCLLAACGADDPPFDRGDAGGTVYDDDNLPPPPAWNLGPALPQPLSNNAVAALDGDDGCTIYSVGGIGAARTRAAIGGAAFALAPGASAWAALPDLPFDPPRIATSAVGLRGELYVVGGYSVAMGGAETSHADLAIFDPLANAWRDGPPLLVATDDAVVATWRDRYLVVVSGWSNGGSIDDVQLYDAETGMWTMADGFPGTPVFGAAGGIVGDTLLFVDGVAGSSSFTLTAQTWRGDLDPDDPGAISWTELADHPGPARYRAAAGALGDSIAIAGGTGEPYNYDGLTYAGGDPATPIASTLIYRPGAPPAAAFADGPDAPAATMDHRALASCGDQAVRVGGMAAGPAVTDGVATLSY
jgi:N-acetylneuraminic acid mutarotase